MIFKRLYDEQLAQASYLIGCERTRTAIVVDPKRDADIYLDVARVDRLTITHVTETHIHADFVSGTRELAQHADASVLLSNAGGPDWLYRWATDAGAQLLENGSTFSVGDISVQALHTPGHTPEHMTFLVTDPAMGEKAIGALTGDFIFVGDVGRPDLLERAAGIQGTKEASARSLFESLQKFKQLPDYLQIWPGHGAGSACGKSLGAMPQSTLGYEKLFNWALQETNEARFVKQVLEGQSEPPAYFAIMKRVNRDGPPPRMLPKPRTLRANDVKKLVADVSSVVVDTRLGAEFATEHLAGSINIPHSRSFLKWSGSLLPYDVDINLIVPGGVAGAEAILKELSLIGIDRVTGVFAAEEIPDAERAGAPTSAISHVSVADVAASNGKKSRIVLDVRNDDEWSEGHVPGAVHIPLGSLPKRLAELPEDQPIAVHCQGGGRSAIASSVLKNAGRDVYNMSGGFSEWQREGNPIARGDS